MCTLYCIHASRPFGHAATCQTICKTFYPHPVWLQKTLQAGKHNLAFMCKRKRLADPGINTSCRTIISPIMLNFVKSSHRYFLNSYLDRRMQGEWFANYAWKWLPIHYRSWKFKQKLLPLIRHAYIYYMTAITIKFASFFCICHCSMTFMFHSIGIITHTRFIYNMYNVMPL
jgi:hypothetical protein